MGVTAYHGPHKVLFTLHNTVPGWHLLYQHTSDLLCLDCCRPLPSPTAAQLMPVSTPLVVDALEHALASHPDRAYAHYIYDGLRHGFGIGFNRSSLLKSASANMESARQHPNIITEYLQNELSLGRMLGPFTETDDLPLLQVNSLG